VNAPIKTPTITGTAASLFIWDDIVEPLRSTLISPKLTPLDADIAREDQEAEKKRTATPWEVLETLKLSKHTKRLVGNSEFMEWLSAHEWPEEQVQKMKLTTKVNSRMFLIKLFKAHDGLAVKWIPILQGGRLDTRGATYALFTLVGV